MQYAGSLIPNSEIIIFDESTNFTIPQRKTFRDIQIAGPFKVYIGDAEEASELFFISRVNGQQEVLRYMLNHPWVLLLMTLIITTPLLWWFTYTIVKPITIWLILSFLAIDTPPLTSQLPPKHSMARPTTVSNALIAIST